MKKVIAIALTATALAGCEYVPFTDANRIEAAKKRIAILSANPMTVQWGEVKAGPSGSVCGTFNAQEEGYPVRSEVTWSGPTDFVTIDGRPVIANNYEDCDAVVGAWSRCINDDDTAKVTADVQACKAFQQEDSDGMMARVGLIATGDIVRDRATVQASLVASRVHDGRPLGDNETLSATVASGRLFIRAYNARMRQVPNNATRQQKVAAANEAATAATAASEALLQERGVQ